MFKKVYILYSAFCTHPAFYSRPAVCFLHSVCILPLVRSLQSAVRSLRFTLTFKYLCYLKCDLIVVTSVNNIVIYPLFLTLYALFQLFRGKVIPQLGGIEGASIVIEICWFDCPNYPLFRTWTIDEIINRWQSITIDDNRYQLIDWYW